LAGTAASNTLLREAVVGAGLVGAGGAFVLRWRRGLQRVGFRRQFLECLHVLADKPWVHALRKGFVLVWR
jgi:hypothetical protein